MDLELTARIKGSYNSSIRYARVVPESTTVPRPCDTVNAAGSICKIFPLTAMLRK